MNKTISIIRIAILFALAGIAAILLFGEEQDESLSAFFIHFIVDKAIAAALIYSALRLYNRWSKVDPWLKAYDKECDKAMEESNPSQL